MSTGAEPESTTVITQVIHFPDGSRLRVLVDAPAGSTRDALVGARTDLATVMYYLFLMRTLDAIEAEVKQLL